MGHIMRKNKYIMISLWISAFLILIYIIQVIYPPITEHFLLNSLVTKQPYRLITSIFLHYNAEHLVQNITALLIFGLILEGIIGWENFLLLFIISGIVGNIFMIMYDPGVNGLGSSGAIMGIIGALTYLRPWMPIYFIAPLPVVALGIIYFLIDFIGLLHPTDNIGYAAHIGGFITGIIWAYLYKKISISESKEEDELIEDNKSV